MKLNLSLLQKFIELPTADPAELRSLFDEVIEVKNVVKSGDAHIFTIETLANRGDHLSALGIARELSARFLTQLKLPSVAAQLSDRKTSIPVRKATDLCLRYALLEMSVPERMQLRADLAGFLDAGGGKHGIVDLINYVQLELGQPMHAFDREKVDGEIVVVVSDKSEKIDALDGKSYEVPPGSLLIRDKSKVLAVAGVIGCSNSMVTQTTTRVLVESATFDPVTVRKTARAMGISTEASHIFERGADVEQVVYALKRFLFLAQGAQGSVRDAASCHPLGFTFVEGAPLQKRKLTLRFQIVRKQLGLPRLPEPDITIRLKFLGFNPEGATDKEVKVTVPSWRLWDVKNEEDVLEEFVRAYGYNRVKIELPPISVRAPIFNANEQVVEELEPVLHGNGFYEVISKGFYSQERVSLLEKLDPSQAGKHLMLRNSIEKANSAMKRTNLFHLCDILERNLRQGVHSCKVYELGRLFTNELDEEGPYEYEKDTLTFGVSGSWYEHEWGKQESLEERLLLMKGVVEGISKRLGAEANFVQSKNPLLHPGYQIAVKVGTTRCGFFGSIHPDIKDELGLKQDVIYGEFEMAALVKVKRDKEVTTPSNFPSIRRDLTLKIGLKEMSSQAGGYVRGLKIETLREIDAVDQFQREGEQFRRVTYRFTFQSSERTLAHEEVDAHMKRILDTLGEKKIELAP